MKNVRVNLVGPIIHCSPDLTKVELCRILRKEMKCFLLLLEQDYAEAYLKGETKCIAVLQLQEN